MGSCGDYRHESDAVRPATPGITPGKWRMPKVKYEDDLMEFARRVLSILESEEDWGADTLAEIADEAVNRGLACSKDGLFKAVEVVTVPGDLCQETELTEHDKDIAGDNGTEGRTNEDRAREFEELCAGSLTYDADGREAVVDIVTNAMHWLERQGEDVQEVIRIAREHWEAERKGEEDGEYSN